jgi:hypothetical protein
MLINSNKQLPFEKQFIMQTIKIGIICITISLLTGVNSMCDDPINNVTGRDWWYFINYINKEEYERYWKRQKKLSELGLKFFNFDSVEETECLKKIIEILQIEENGEEKIVSDISISSDAITGYKYYDPNIHISRLPQKNSIVSIFDVNQTQWAEKLNLTPIINSVQGTVNRTGGIRVYIGIADNNEKVKILLMKQILSGSMIPIQYLNLCKIDKGPGEVCLIHVDNGEYLGHHNKNLPNSTKNPIINDRRIAFVRCNVAVYLCSYYMNFGCMDLACRLDALIVEQMRKQQEKMGKKKPTND